jgi:CRISPR type III-A-associated protein Csm2
MPNLPRSWNFKTGEHLGEYFSDHAATIARLFQENRIITTTQYRKFYDWILRQAERAEGISEEQFQREVLPMVKLLLSKVAYAKTRNNCKQEFQVLMTKWIQAVNSKEELRNFKLMMEAILGFMPKR